MQGVRHSPYKRNAFMTAVRKGNIERVREIISSRDLSDSQEWSDALNGYLLLLTALQNKHTDVAKLLLTNGSKVNKNHKKPCNTPLYHAVRNGDLEIVQMLLDRGANINIQTLKRKTALHIAVEDKKMDIISILLNHGASVKISDINDITPLHTATKSDSTEIVKLLVSRGADVNARTCNRVVAEGGNGSTPLHLAVENANEEIIKLLLNSGANVNAERNDGITSLHIAMERGYLQIAAHLLKCGASLNAVHTSATWGSYTPLHRVAELNAEQITQLLLLQHNGDVNASDEYGRMPLHFVVSNEGQTHFGFPITDPNVKGEVAKLLLSRGANPNTRVKNSETINGEANADATVENFMTVLHAAVDREYVKVVEVLLEYNADVTSTYEGDMTPLHLSAKRGNKVITQMLLKNGANIDAKDHNGTTALLFATQRCHEEIVELLLKHGADVNATTKRELITPLHLAGEYGYQNIAQLLLNFGANVNPTLNCDTLTPLHKAALNGNVETVEILLQFGASVDSTDKYGTTALHIATKRGDEQIVKLLLENGSDVTIKSKGHYTALCLAMNGIDSMRNTDYDYDYDDDYEATTYVNIAEILKSHMIKMRAANLYAGNEDLLSICRDYEKLSDSEDEYYDVIDSRYGCRGHKERRLLRNKFHSECEIEIAIMKSEKVVNAKITFYDILTKDVGQLAMYARNENIVKALGSGDYKKKFPIYASMLNINFRKGENRRMFLERGNKIFDLFFNDFPGLPRECTERILSYLKDDDLRALANVGMPTVHCRQS